MHSEQHVTHQHASSMQSQREAANLRAASPPIVEGERRFAAAPSASYYPTAMYNHYAREPGQRLSIQTELPPGSSGAPSAYPPTILSSNTPYGSPTAAFVLPPGYQSAYLNPNYGQPAPLTIGRAEGAPSPNEPQPSSHRGYIYAEAGPSRSIDPTPATSATGQSLARQAFGATTTGSSAVMELDSPAVQADASPPARILTHPKAGAYSKTGFNVLPYLAAVVNRDNSHANRKVSKLLGPEALNC